MRRQSRHLSVLTGFATVAAVLAGFSENLLTNDVPTDWRSAAWVAVLVAVILQLLIVSQERRGWFLNSMYVLLGFPIGVGVNVVAAGLPPNIIQTWTYVFLLSFLFLMLLSATIGNIPKVRLPSGWAALTMLMWVFWGIASGTVGGVQMIEYVNAHGGLGVMQAQNANIYPQCFVPLALIPFIGSVLASWVRGKIGSGISAGLLGSTVTMLIIVLYTYPTLAAQDGGLVLYLILALMIGATVGGISGLVGALFGVRLHNIKWWATSDAQ